MIKWTTITFCGGLITYDSSPVVGALIGSRRGTEFSRISSRQVKSKLRSCTSQTEEQEKENREEVVGRGHHNCRVLSIKGPVFKWF